MIILQDYVGNGMLMTLGNLSLNSKMGIIIPNFATGDLLQMTGDAEAFWAGM